MVNKKKLIFIFIEGGNKSRSNTFEKIKSRGELVVEVLDPKKSLWLLTGLQAGLSFYIAQAGLWQGEEGHIDIFLVTCARKHVWMQ